MKKKEAIQTNLFKKERNLVSLEEFKAICESNASKTQHEKKLMEDMMRIAKSLGLPCVHIEHFCGNKFYPVCSGSKARPHRPTKAICPVCRRNILAHCLNRINKGLAGHFDILGISWAMETKHKINKGKQKAKLDPRQEKKEMVYNSFGVPCIAINESGAQKGFDFLRNVAGKFKEFLKGTK